MAEEENKIDIVDFGNDSFDLNESISGIDESGMKYLKNYKYFMYMDSNEMVIVDNETKVEVYRGTSIEEATVYYGHPSVRLTKGMLRGEFDSSKWSEDEKDVLAKTYSTRSKGDFIRNGYSEYLNIDKEKKKRMTRFYFFFIAPGLPTKFDIIAASFGISGLMAYKDFIKEKDSIKIKNANGELASSNLPPAFVKVNITVNKAKNDLGQTYFHPVFKIARSENGNVLYSFKNPDEYRNSEIGLQRLEKIRESHDAAIAFTEIDSTSNHVNKLMLDSFQSLGDTGGEIPW